MNEIDVAIPAVEAGEAVVGHRFGTTLHHLDKEAGDLKLRTRCSLCFSASGHRMPFSAAHPGEAGIGCTLLRQDALP
jgi:hypothetical protein